MGKASQALSLRSYSIRKDLTDVNPDDRALRECEERNVANEGPNQQVLVFACMKQDRNSCQAKTRSDWIR